MSINLESYISYLINQKIEIRQQNPEVSHSDLFLPLIQQGALAASSGGDEPKIYNVGTQWQIVRRVAISSEGPQSYCSSEFLNSHLKERLKGIFKDNDLFDKGGLDHFFLNLLKELNKDEKEKVIQLKRKEENCFNTLIRMSRTEVEWMGRVVTSLLQSPLLFTALKVISCIVRLSLQLGICFSLNVVKFLLLYITICISSTIFMQSISINGNPASDLLVEDLPKIYSIFLLIALGLKDRFTEPSINYIGHKIDAITDKLIEILFKLGEDIKIKIDQTMNNRFSLEFVEAYSIWKERVLASPIN